MVGWRFMADHPIASSRIAVVTLLAHRISSGRLPTGRYRTADPARRRRNLLQRTQLHPTEVGYQGGAWNLQIFHWNAGQTPYELSSDTDIAAALAAGKGMLEITNILVRCPVVNFAALR